MWIKDKTTITDASGGSIQINDKRIHIGLRKTYECRSNDDAIAAFELISRAILNGGQLTDISKFINPQTGEK